MSRTKRVLKAETLPLLALRGLVVFPHMSLHFDVGREKSIEALNQAMSGNQTIFLVTQKDMTDDDPSPKQLYTIGAVAQIRQVLRLPGSGVRVMVEGLYRAKIRQITQREPFMLATIMECPEKPVQDHLNEMALMRDCRSYFEAYAKLAPRMSQDVTLSIHSLRNASHLADFIASNLPLSVEEKQTMLQTLPIGDRMEQLMVLMEREGALLALEQDIQQRVQEQVDQNQKEYYLREQMKAISEELGEADNPLEESEEYRDQIEAMTLPEETAEKLLKECDKFQKMPTGSHEATVVRNYLDTVLSLPWNESSKDKTDLQEAARILDRDHYGLQKVKERMLEALAVRQLTDRAPGNIICLVGPPGVGKTSIAKSIAEALGRKYVRVSLGGVRDEADIRGHRKTYIGAMMGRIMAAIKQAGTNNPLLLLDEVDKLGNDFRGDPSAALLEVLDVEQNHAFTDHYVEVPFDLSRVLFVTTANDAGAIPDPLYDRMDVIALGSYTAEEKFHIAKEHLLKKQLKANGLTARQMRLSDKQLRLLIDGYTREAGVRQLERCLGTLCRKTAKRLVEGDVKSVTISHLEEFLGPIKYKPDEEKHTDAVGLVNGLAWTSVGGEMLPIEVAVLEGTGKIELTGSLGDVMKESAHIAVSYVRSRAAEWQLDQNFYKQKDIHIHAPEGAVPKDGPSAGAAMATAVLSALSGIPVRGKLAMTGELSLRGRVLPIGGLKEKLMAAYTHKMQTVLIPAENVSDLAEVDEAVKNGLDIVPVGHMDDVLRLALAKPVLASELPRIPARHQARTTQPTQPNELPLI